MKVFLIIQELAKAILIAFYWLFPIYMWQVSQESGYLWFFIVSFLLTVATFTHYEVLLETMCGGKVTTEKEQHKVRVEDLYPNHDEGQD